MDGDVESEPDGDKEGEIEGELPFSEGENEDVAGITIMSSKCPDNSTSGESPDNSTSGESEGEEIVTILSTKQPPSTSSSDTAVWCASFDPSFALCRKVSRQSWCREFIDW